MGMFMIQTLASAPTTPNGMPANTISGLIEFLNWNIGDVPLAFLLCIAVRECNYRAAMTGVECRTFHQALSRNSTLVFVAGAS
jgi:hypothetical protein